MSHPTYSRVRTRSGAVGRNYPSFLDKEENKENYDPDTGEVSVAHSQYYLARNRPPVVPVVTVPPTPSLVEKKPAAPISLIERERQAYKKLSQKSNDDAQLEEMYKKKNDFLCAVDDFELVEETVGSSATDTNFQITKIKRRKDLKKRPDKKAKMVQNPVQNPVLRNFRRPTTTHVPKTTKDKSSAMDLENNEAEVAAFFKSHKPMGTSSPHKRIGH